MTTRNINALADAQALGWADARFTRLAANSVSLNGRMSFSGQSLTGSQEDSLLGLAATWNTTGTPTAFDLNVTDTASNAASLLMDLRVGGVSQFYVTKSAKIGSSVTSNPAIEFGNQAFNFSWYGQSPALALTRSSTPSFRAAGDGGFEWTNGGAHVTGTVDLMLRRDAANTLAQRNGANAQAFRIYNTYTDASNYERGVMRWDSNVLEIGPQVGGTGVNRSIRILLGSGANGGRITNLDPTNGAVTISGGGNAVTFASNILLHDVNIVSNQSFTVGPTNNDSNLTLRKNGTGQIILSGVPTSDPLVSGAIWNEGGTLKIST